MNMRWLWAVLFVVAPLAAVAGYGSTYGVTSMGGGGGGVTVGAAVSGGTASTLLFSDASTQVSTATPALGRALTLSDTLRVDGAITAGTSATCGSITGSAGSVCLGEASTVNGVLYVSSQLTASPITLQGTSGGGWSLQGPNIGLLTATTNNKYGILAGTPSAVGNDVALLTAGETCTQGSACTGAKAATFYGGGLAAFGNTHQTATISSAANLDPTSSRIILTCNTAASSFAITLQETTVAATAAQSFAHGADVTICSSMSSNASCTLTFADVAGVFNGAAPSLGVGDCFRIFYADESDDIWLQASPVSDN